MNHYFLFENKSSYPKIDAQKNLEGRTHYVDDDTLKYFNSRVLSTGIFDGGLLFYIIESYAHPEKNKRCFRGVIFSLTGDVIYKPKLDEGFASKNKALDDLYQAANKIDAVKVTKEGLNSDLRWLNSTIDRVNQDIDRLISENKTGKAA